MESYLIFAQELTKNIRGSEYFPLFFVVMHARKTEALPLLFAMTQSFCKQHAV